VLTFDNHDLPIPLPKIEAFRTRGGADRERTIPELLRVGNDASQPVATRLESRANFHFRIVEVMSMFLIPLIAVALAIPPKRSTSALGVFLSIVILVTQHKINEYAEGLGSRGAVDPLIALWVPFALFAALAFWMYHVLAHVPGGQPIGALERVATITSARIRAIREYFEARGKRALLPAE
jgi:lipopolysaccharide export system permease protein